MAPRGSPVALPRIVMADNDQDTLTTLSTILGDEGHVVYIVHSGKEVRPALRLLRPYAVVLDLALPGISGYAVAHEIRHTYLNIRRPLLIGTSGKWKERSDRMLAQQVGFDHHLVKPCDPSQLLARLGPLAHPPAV